MHDEMQILKDQHDLQIDIDQDVLVVFNADHVQLILHHVLEIVLLQSHQLFDQPHANDDLIYRMLVRVLQANAKNNNLYLKQFTVTS